MFVSIPLHQQPPYEQVLVGMGRVCSSSPHLPAPPSHHVPIPVPMLALTLALVSLSLLFPWSPSQLLPISTLRAVACSGGWGCCCGGGHCGGGRCCAAAGVVIPIVLHCLVVLLWSSRLSLTSCPSRSASFPWLLSSSRFVVVPAAASTLHPPCKQGLAAVEWQGSVRCYKFIIT